MVFGGLLGVYILAACSAISKPGIQALDWVCTSRYSTDEPYPFVLALVAPLFRLNEAKLVALAQDAGTVGDTCTVDSDCGTTGRDLDEQIRCSSDGLCGGKGSYCLYNGNFAGYSDACASRTFSHLPVSDWSWTDACCSSFRAGSCKVSFSCESPTAVGAAKHVYL